MKHQSINYPPVSEWGIAPDEFSWLKNRLTDGEYSTQCAKDLSTFIIAKWHSLLKAHLRNRFAEMPMNWRYVRRETYPPIEDWREYHRNLPLQRGEFTIIVNPRTGLGIRIVARYGKILVCHPYLDNTPFEEWGYKLVPYKVVVGRGSIPSPFSPAVIFAAGFFSTKKLHKNLQNFG